VTGVKPGSAANRAGIREGDIIREINRQVVKTDLSTISRGDQSLASIGLKALWAISQRLTT